MLQVGDTVGYTARFLASIGADADVAARTGTIVDVLDAGKPTPRRRARVRWDDGETSSALLVNIAARGSWRHADPAAPKIR